LLDKLFAELLSFSFISSVVALEHKSYLRK
jgi:hypothetical protein